MGCQQTKSITKESNYCEYNGLSIDLNLDKKENNNSNTEENHINNNDYDRSIHSRFSSSNVTREVIL